MSPAQIDELGADFGNEPVCVGPFEFVERVVGDHTTLQRSERLLRQGQRLPRHDHLPARSTDETVRTANLRSGDLQVVDRLATTDVEGLRRRSGVHGPRQGLERVHVHDIQHRQRQRHRGATRRGRQPVRRSEAPRGVRAGDRSRPDQPDRLQRLAGARMRPDLAGKPVLRREHLPATRPRASPGAGGRHPACPPRSPSSSRCPLRRSTSGSASSCSRRSPRPASTCEIVPLENTTAFDEPDQRRLPR